MGEQRTTRQVADVDFDDFCPHFVEREGCVMCAPRYQGKDIRDGICPAHSGASTWHIVNDDGTSECCACGHVHPYELGILESHRCPAEGTTT